MIRSFIGYISDIFMKKFIEDPLCDLFFQEITPIPDFFISHFYHKVWTLLRERINAFQSGFVTTLEENWLNFVTEERKNLQFFDNKQAYKPKSLEPDILIAAFSIIVILPMRKEVKHDLTFVFNKI